MNWGDLLAAIRTDLKDTGSTPKWSDDTLFLFAKDAIRVYSQDCPRYMFRTTLTAENGTFPLPTNFLVVSTVEVTEGEYLEMFEPKPGRKLRTPLRATKFFVAGGRLHLDLPPSDGDTVLMSYRALHDVPASKDDLTFALTVPAEDEELIRLYVRARAIDQMRTNQANLDRFKQGTGDRQDNPLIPESRELMMEFRRRMAEKLGGVITLHITGRL
jgi:hypothetical protein